MRVFNNHEGFVFLKDYSLMQKGGTLWVKLSCFFSYTFSGFWSVIFRDFQRLHHHWWKILTSCLKLKCVSHIIYLLVYFDEFISVCFIIGIEKRWTEDPYIQNLLLNGTFPWFSSQTLYLASMLIKALWNNALAAKAQLSKQSSFASLLSTNLPMGNKKGACFSSRSGS